MSNHLLVNSPVDTLCDARDNPGEKPTLDDLITLLCRSLAVLWKDWPKQMKLTALEAPSGKFSLSGKCPHCQQGTVFMQVTSVFQDHLADWDYRLAVGMQCQGCLECVLAIALKTAQPNKPTNLSYVAHYPLGNPDDSVDENVPKPIAEDFSEAMRCLWIKSYKAAVAMCRRSVEATCKHFGATGGNLEKKIDSLAAQGKINAPLKDMAHAVRLSGNRGLHGKKSATQNETAEAEKASEQETPLDDLDLFGEDEAKAMIVFTQQLFYNLFVIPALLEKYKPKPKGGASDAS